MVPLPCRAVALQTEMTTRRSVASHSVASLLVLVLVAGGCATKTPPPEYGALPAADALYAEGVSMMEQQDARFLWRDYSTAIEVFQDIIDNYPYSDEAVLAELAIADAYFSQKSYAEAISYYTDFADLHPEHPKVPYAIFHSALSHSEQSKGPERDQTETRKAITELEALLSRYPHSAYSDEAEAELRMLRTRLARSGMMVGDFYFKRREYQAAAERYRGLLNRYPGLGLDAEALYKLGLCYTRMNREDEAHHIFQVILDNYEGSDVADAAADLIPAAN
jgi:outer membrane protein assembly factor BamD